MLEEEEREEAAKKKRPRRSWSDKRESTHAEDTLRLAIWAKYSLASF